MEILKAVRSFFQPEQRSLSAQSEYNLLTAGFASPSHKHFVGIPAPAHALRNSVVYSCIKLLSETLSTLPVRLVERESKRDAIEHPVYRLLQSPNPEQTWVEFMEMLACHYFTFGNCYAEKEVERGQIVGLYPMNAARTTAIRKDGRLLYDYVTTEKVFTIPGEYVMAVRMFGLDDLTGMAPIWAADKAIKLALTQEKMIADGFEDGISPDFVIKLPPERVLERLAEIDGESLRQEKVTLQKQIEEGRTRRGMYIPFGYDITPYSSNYQQFQVAELRDGFNLELARFWRVPPSKLGVLSKGDSAASSEQQQLAFYVDCIRPALAKFEKRLERDLLSDQDREKYAIRFNVRALLRGDIASQTEQYVKLWQIGALLTNEIRNLEDLPPFDDERASTPNFPVNMTTENVAGAAQITNPADGGVPARQALPAQKRTVEPLTEVRQRSLTSRKSAVRATKPLFHAAVAKIVRKEKATIMKDARKILGSRSVENLEDRVRQLYAGELRQFIEDNITQPVEVLFNHVREAMEQELEYGFDAGELRKIVLRYVAIWARDYIASSTGQIIDVIRSAEDQADIVDDLEQRFTEWEEGAEESGVSRADKESEQESSKGSNVFSKALYVLAGVSMLRWVTSDPCEICEPFDGMTFSTKASITPPPIHRACGCQITSA